VELVRYNDMSKKERTAWDSWYKRKVHPVLTPLAVGPTRPFPFISNLSLNLAVMVRSPTGEERLARVKIPGMLPRLVPLTTEPHPQPPLRYLRLEELVAANLDALFPGLDVGTPWVFRVTRDADVEISEDEADDLLKAVEQEVRKRRFGFPVRLEVQTGTPQDIVRRLQRGLDVDPDNTYEVGEIVGVPRLTDLLQADLPELKYPPFVPRRPKLIDEDLFTAIRAQDHLLHHPFQSFTPVVEFIRAAARDPKVLAIKQTLYRTSGDSPVIRALEQAIENGKQVAAVVELKARFDEENNIVWARQLEEAGVHVIYGFPGLKVHSKLAMVVRDEGGELRRYAHIGTGNYNPNTARVYTDLGLLTADPEITADVAEVFNRLTGFAQPDSYGQLLVAPNRMKIGLLAHIKAEADNARAGRPAHIILKCNAITDTEIIRELYTASAAGVRIEMLVRGICCLIPGQEGLSENITVRSVVGRFLEHSRVYWFANNGDPIVYIGSADLMERNLRRRVEVLTPIRDPDHRRWIGDVYLRRYLDDDKRTRIMLPDGTYRRLRTPESSNDVHEIFMASDGHAEPVQ
jgi:polyphosphate kinase